MAETQKSALLSEHELVQLTGRVRPAAQRRALARMGIRHWTRADGHTVVPRAAIDRPEQTELLGTQPNWGAL
jgi:hypothetical protein